LIVPPLLLLLLRVALREVSTSNRENRYSCGIEVKASCTICVYLQYVQYVQ
jgi:hypothetical protein